MASCISSIDPKESFAATAPDWLLYGIADDDISAYRRRCCGELARLLKEQQREI